MSRLTPAQKAKLLQTAISESAETPQTMEATAKSQIALSVFICG
jgi:hypothetical protein